MRYAEIEVYADTSNAAILRHPDRRFPGCLIQGDSLHSMLQSLKVVACESSALSEDAAAELQDVISALTDRLNHYKLVLREHQLDLPFCGGA